MYILAMYMLEGPYFPVGNRDLPAHTESSGTVLCLQQFSQHGEQDTTILIVGHVNRTI